MIYVFDFDLLKGATENSKIIVKDKNGNTMSISSLTTNKDGDVVLTVGEPKFCDIRKCEKSHSSCDDCFTKNFWMDVLNEKTTHFVDGEGDVMYFTDGNGGFYGARFNVEFENGVVLKDKGLWYRGKVPSSYVRDNLKKAIIERCDL